MTSLMGWCGTSLGRDAGHEALGSLESTNAGSIHGDAGDGWGLLVSGDGYAVSDSVRLAFHGRVHWVDGTAVSNSGNAEVARRLLEGYTEYGQGFLDRIKGSFSLLVIDSASDSAIFAIDRIGQQALYYTDVGDGVIVANRLGDILQYPGINRDISDQGVYDYVYYHHCPSPGSIYKGIRKLEGGQCVRFSQGRLAERFYWTPEFHEHLGGTEEAAREQLLVLLGEAVKRESGDPASTGAFLSGGLDSSTVSGLLSRVHPEQCNTFSIGFPVAGYDESEYARTAAKHFATRHHELILHPEQTVDAVLEIADYYDEPFGNSSALPALFCARLAAENGVNRMLAGDGGDELFAGNERYKLQLLFERYAHVPKAVRTFLEVGLSSLPAGFKRKGVLQKAVRYIQQATTPLPDRLEDYNFLHRHAPDTVFSGDFLEDVDFDQPLELLREVYRRPGNADAMNRMLYMDWKRTLHDNDLVKVNRMCDLAGVEVCYPMLDDEVIAFSTGVPSGIKMKNGRLRGFFKDSVKGFLPEKIINKSKHGFGLPFGVWLSEYAPLRELAYDSISTLKGRGFFTRDFLDHTIEMHRSIHAGYYGELIWILMMLELWFEGRNKR